MKDISILFKQTVAVVCNDAGSANIVIAWLKAVDRIRVRPLMQGPAELLWHAAFPNRPLYQSLEQVLEGAQILISGTGWASSIEHQARQLARAYGIHSVGVLDHWVNYAARFERNGQVQLPDEIWVTDADALALAKQSLPGVPVRQLENFYLAEQVRRICSPPGNGTLLVILEPVRETWGCSQAGEFQALDYLFQHLGRVLPAGVMKIILRSHPSESPDKYQTWLSRDPRVCIDDSPDVASSISKADVVVGLESFALTIALAAGREVYSSLPPWAPPLRLPHAGIKQIRHMSPL